MRYFPAFIELRRRPALVVVGGDAAARKAELLVRAGANVAVAAEEPGADLRALAESGRVTLIERTFRAADLAGCTVIIAATGDEHADTAVSEAARGAGIPVNVVDAPALSTFIVPAIVDRDPLTVAISSGGASPVLARVVRARVEALLPTGLGRLARFAEGFRRAVRGTIADGLERRRFWERFFAGPVAEAVLAGDERWARERMLKDVNAPVAERAPEGIVHLVGAGPGDPDLLTLRAHRLLQDADVIVYDRLVAPELLDYARRDAERIYVGKARGAHVRSQDEINAVLEEHARTGRRVVRLKGGDPFVFGRGGEERDHLTRAGIRAEVVPGITAATGCAAAAGIPLTDRDLAHGVSIVTGQGRDGEADVDWAAMARSGQTIVVYMGAKSADRIAGRLIESGLSAATPAAVIENGTRADQRIETGRVADLGALAARFNGHGPLLIVIGDVVRRADAWSETTAPLRAAAG